MAAACAKTSFSTLIWINNNKDKDGFNSMIVSAEAVFLVVCNPFMNEL
jgi:hypothetical protein